MKGKNPSKDIIIIGASGHARVCMDVLQLQGRTVAGFCDDNPGLQGRQIYGLPVLGNINEYLDKMADYDIFIGIGDNNDRKHIAYLLSEKGIKCNVNAIHPSVIMSQMVKMGIGNFIAPGVVIEINVSIGNYVIINSNASVSHDCVLHDFSQISPGCNIAGNVTIEEGAFLGTGAVVIPGKVIGAYSIIGAGAVVIDNIPPHCTAVGVPARVIKIDRKAGGNKYESR